MQTKFTRAALSGLAGISILATAAPAIARDADPKTGRAAVAKAKAAESDGVQRYCVDSAHTGTRINRRTCLTAAEWSAQGVDILAEAAKSARR